VTRPGRAQGMRSESPPACPDDCSLGPASPYQAAVAAYQKSFGAPQLFSFHSNWHAKNIPPGANPNDEYDPHWGQNQPFGRAFLDMHHSMLFDQGTGTYMGHEGFFVWCSANAPDLLNAPVWDPTQYTHNTFAYTPRTCDIPQQILALRVSLEAAAAAQGKRAARSIGKLLCRSAIPPNPQLPALPACFTLAGAEDGQGVEPNTGFLKLADFQSVEQLGCCLSGIHAMWHLLIGGAMGNLASSIADPIFYFGVHRLIDSVYTTYLSIGPPAGIRLSNPTKVTAAQRQTLVQYDRANRYLTRSLRPIPPR
jgi:hypothetical protein